MPPLVESDIDPVADFAALARADGGSMPVCSVVVRRNVRPQQEIVWLVHVCEC